MSIGNLWRIDSGGMHYNFSTSIYKFNQVGAFTVDATGGRFGEQALRLTAGGPNWTLDFATDTLYCGAAFKYQTGATSFGASPQHVFLLQDTGTVQIGLSVLADGRLRVWSNNSSLTIVESLYSLHVGGYYYIELYGVVHQSAGIIRVRVNEVDVINASGKDTQATANQQITHIGIGAVDNSTICWVDDLYIHKTENIGDVEIGVILPNGVGDSSGWTPSTGATIWDLIDEVPPTGDTDYCSTASIGTDFLVNMQDVTLTGVCRGIQVLSLCRKDDSNVRKVKTRIKEGGTTTDGDEFSLSTDYLYVIDCYEKNPRTGANWTDAELDSIQSGTVLTV